MQKRLIIAYVISNLRKTGPTVQLRNLIKYLDRSIFEPVIITLSSEDKGLSMIDDFRNMNVQIESLNYPKGVLPSKNSISAIFNKVKPHVLHTHGFRPDVLSLSVVGADIRKITTIHCNPFEDYPRLYGIRGFVAAMYHTVVLGKIPTKVCCSESLAKNLKKFGLRTIVIPNSAELNEDLESLRTKREKIRTELGFHNEDFVFIYVGELIKRKNITFLMNIFNKAPRNIYLMVVGDGKEKVKYHNKSPENSIFVGRQPNVAPFLIAADSFISASLSEGLPTSVLEALSVGIPVFLSDIPAHREIHRLAEKSKIRIGKLFSLGNPSDVSLELQKFAMEKYQAGDIVEFFNQNFAAKSMSKRYQELYIRLVEKSVGS